MNKENYLSFFHFKSAVCQVELFIIVPYCNSYL